MKINKISLLLAAGIFAAPLTALAQIPPQVAVVTTQSPGKVGEADAIQIQGKVKSINKKTREVTLVGPQGNQMVIPAGEDVKNFDQIRVGDLVTLTYVQALVLELKTVQNNGIRERVESENKVAAKPGEKPAGMIEKTTRIVANVVAVNPKAQTVTLRGPKRTVEVAVKDPAMLKEIKVGNQVEATFIEAVALVVTADKKAK
jgi:Cu/Ag efflux protein CusF